MSKLITVGISDLNVAQNGDGLITHALGSCVGICLYDGTAKIAGMAHIMLPSNKGFEPVGRQMYKFADSAIPLLVEKMESVGARKTRLCAKIAGGAQMFACVSSSGLAHIGERNVLEVRNMLRSMGIPIVADDTGGDYGRTQLISSEDGIMVIRTANRIEKMY